MGFNGYFASLWGGGGDGLKNTLLYIQRPETFLRMDLVLRKNKDITVQLRNIDFTSPFEAGILAVHTLE